jgi:hypothetical protein
MNLTSRRPIPYNGRMPSVTLSRPALVALAAASCAGSMATPSRRIRVVFTVAAGSVSWRARDG